MYSCFWSCAIQDHQQDCRRLNRGRSMCKHGSGLQVLTLHRSYWPRFHGYLYARSTTAIRVQQMVGKLGNLSKAGTVVPVDPRNVAQEIPMHSRVFEKGAHVSYSPQRGYVRPRALATRPPSRQRRGLMPSCREATGLPGTYTCPHTLPGMALRKMALDSSKIKRTRLLQWC